MAKKQEAICLSCDEQFYFNPTVSLGKYCSNKCQQSFQRLNNVKNGTAGWGSLKTYIKELAGGRCQICDISDWLGKPVLLVCDHIDGNSNNNSIDNLRAICSNCDATLPTYKSKNRGHGRESRRKHAAKALK